ncbi:hypothetical protein [Halobacillus ihumii]|uniref:hypothetical protein n=1 Tax=Halobacillus ihumii TaxID=2686092 RepID=UPI0013D5727F|nr:hypothetical protein [Halobacillus ihumii]
MSVKQWVQLLKNFIAKKFKDDLELSYDLKAEKLNSFFIIKSKKPNHFSEDSWRKLTEDAIKVLKTKIQYSAVETYGQEQQLTFYSSIYDSLENFPDSLSLEIHKKISKSFVEYKMNEYHFILDSINKCLSEKKPSFVIEGDWKKYTNHLGDLQHMYLLIEMYKSFSQPLEVYNKYEDIIHQRSASLFESKDSLYNIAYNIEYYKFISNILTYSKLKASNLPVKPEWMKENHYNTLKEIVERITSVDDKQKDVTEQIDVISDAIVFNRLPDEKPKHMNDYQWEKISNFVTQSKEIKDLKERIEQREEEVNELEEKVIKQQEDVNVVNARIKLTVFA